ncbi:hypothetical protein GCG54_00001833 [Colletotrichum gloeosporioides]|uniref:Uncharacterized protein n=1 Tax=Colletotrichum gloeosporioides TaxID=474922 RepID=A0A8H4CWX5_COLGL|nr:uncharacterized protein GCG54_00001833 [Colletotrichum gloeosporioides]KAF3811507.1 hypothetical protein GCG54_00001833 [Colletotrichum gloeosporioides]
MYMATVASLRDCITHRVDIAKIRLDKPDELPDADGLFTATNAPGPAMAHAVDGAYLPVYHYCHSLKFGVDSGSFVPV